MPNKIGVIGGSGLYELKELEDKQEVKLKTPFGEPSDKYLTGRLMGQDIVFLARHGKGHRVLPSELNFRANIFGMKKLGVDVILSVSAVGSFKKEFMPLDVVLPDQFVDRTNQGRRMSFFGEGIVAHIAFDEPICPVIRESIFQAARQLGVKVHNGATYLNMEGPAFSTRAESLLYKNWGMDIIGMTNLAEAKLSREAEICFATIAMVTDYDCWHESEEPVTAEMIISNLYKNAETAKDIIKRTLSLIPEKRNCRCQQALKNSIVTPAEYMPPETIKKLDIIINKYVDKKQ